MLQVFSQFTSAFLSLQALICSLQRPTAGGVVRQQKPCPLISHWSMQTRLLQVVLSLLCWFVRPPVKVLTPAIHLQEAPPPRALPAAPAPPSCPASWRLTAWRCGASYEELCRRSAAVWTLWRGRGGRGGRTEEEEVGPFPATEEVNGALAVRVYCLS